MISSRSVRTAGSGVPARGLDKVREAFPFLHDDAENLSRQPVPQCLEHSLDDLRPGREILVPRASRRAAVSRESRLLPQGVLETALMEMEARCEARAEQAAVEQLKDRSRLAIFRRLLPQRGRLEFFQPGHEGALRGGVFDRAEGPDRLPDDDRRLNRASRAGSTSPASLSPGPALPGRDAPAGGI